jgi:uroporphyrinogen-III synthase
LLAEISVGLWKLTRRDWIIFLSSAVIALAIEMAAERWPHQKDHANRISIGNTYQKVYTDYPNFGQGIIYIKFSNRNKKC